MEKKSIDNVTQTKQTNKKIEQKQLVINCECWCVRKVVHIRTSARTLLEEKDWKQNTCTNKMSKTNFIYIFSSLTLFIGFIVPYWTIQRWEGYNSQCPIICRHYYHKDTFISPLSNFCSKIVEGNTQKSDRFWVFKFFFMYATKYKRTINGLTTHTQIHHDADYSHYFYYLPGWTN